MIRKRSFVFGILKTLFSLHSQCKLVDFKSEAVAQRVRFNVEFEFIAAENPLYQIKHLSLDEVYKNAGINPETIQDAFINDIQVQIIDDNAATDTLTGVVSLKIMTPIIPPDTLLNFQNIILSPASNVVFSLSAENSPLAIDYVGQEKLKSLLTRTEPPVIVFFFEGAVESPPVNIQVSIKFDVQIKMKS